MKKKILLVEYATSAIDAIKEILFHPIFEITVANEGDEAKKHLSHQSFDLMITAAMLPKFHGFNLSQYAADNYPDMKIIIISEIYKGMDYKHQATTRYRADDFFEKPLNKDVFKKKVFELLNITPEVLNAQSRLTTTQAPFSDTKKIPTLKKLEEEGKKLTSEDLFGDIIDKVHDLPSYEIQLDTAVETPPGESGLAAGDKKTAHTGAPPVTREFPSRETNKTQKIDMELLDLIRAGRKEKEEQKRKLKKIEDDISKKLEDTLSGLGVTDKSAPPAAAPEPVKQKPGSKPPEAPVIKPKKEEVKEKSDEVSGYELLGLIGRGGMAEIYKAKKKGVKGFEKVIALKKILSGYGEDAKYIEMFVDEAKIAAELSHPNIVQIHDLGKKDDYYFIAMEYVPGKDLRVILQKLAETNKTMPEEVAIAMVIKVLGALHYAHTARDSSGKNLDIVHRDISPPNILVSYDGNIKLTDFGVSKASIKMHQTIAGALKGKLLYMSPEQAKGEETIDYRSDLYSVGIILFELITGEKLFLGTSEMGTLKKVQEGRIIKPSQIKPGIEPELEAVITKALEKDKNKRYQNASAMIKDLDTYMIKYYESVPEPAHIAHFICTLFKEEILKEGIEIPLNPPSYAVTKKSKPEVKEIKKEIRKEEIFDLPEEEQMEDALPVQEDTSAEKQSEQGLREEEEFQPITEIRFDDDIVKSKPETKAFLPEYEALLQEKGSTEKKKLLVAAIIVVAVLAIAVVIYLSLGSGERTPGTQAGPVSTSGAGTEGNRGVVGAEGTADTTASTGGLSSQPEEKPADRPPPSLSVDSATAADTLSEKKKTKEVEEKEPDSKRAREEKKPAPGQQEEIVQDQPKKKRDKTAAEELKKQEQVSPEEKAAAETPQGEKIEEEKPGDAKTETPPLTEKPQPLAGDQKTQPPPEKTPVEPEQKKTVKEGDILSPSQLDTQPVPISTPAIKITHSIRRMMVADQRILVSYLVDHNGNVETVKVLNQSSMNKLNNLIVDTIKKWKYKPATKNKVRVKVWKNNWITIKK
jgi:TonB family protein